MAWAAVAGAGIGLVGSMMSDSGGGQQQTATKEPWAEAAPWLKNQIKQGQQLQDYYQQNPFNAQQQTAYQNTFSDLDNFRNNTAPGLMQFANNAMTGSYQRQPVSRPGMGAGQGGQAPQGQTPGGLMASGQGGQGPFSVAPAVQGGPNNAAAQYGLLDFKAMNPHTNGAISQQAMPDAKTVEQMVAEELARQNAAKQYAPEGYSGS